MMRKFTMALLGGLLLLLNSACDLQKNEAERNQKRIESLDKVDRASIPVGSEFLALYPNATIKYVAVSGADFPGLDFDTTLHQRYTISLRIPVFYSKDGSSVSGYGDPRFYVVEVKSIVAKDGRAHEISYGDEQFEFGLEEWKKLRAAGGNFSSIGHELKKGLPVEGFNMIEAENREQSRKAGQLREK